MKDQKSSGIEVNPAETHIASVPPPGAGRHVHLPGQLMTTGNAVVKRKMIFRKFSMMEVVRTKVSVSRLSLRSEYLANTGNWSSRIRRQFVSYTLFGYDKNNM